MHGKGHPWTFDLTFRTSCAANIEGVVKRAEVMACKVERETVSMHSNRMGVRVLIEGHQGPNDLKYRCRASYTDRNQPDLDGY